MLRTENFKHYFTHLLVLIEFILASESTLLDPCRLKRNKY